MSMRMRAKLMYWIHEMPLEASRRLFVSSNGFWKPDTITMPSSTARLTSEVNIGTFSPYQNYASWFSCHY